MNPERLHVAVLTRAIRSFHGHGGLERAVDDLVRHLLRRGVRVTLITRPPKENGCAPLRNDRLDVRFVPYVTFPFAGRRGTTVVDRSTAYPLFGWRAGRLAAALVRREGVQLVHAQGASGLGYARVRRRDWLGTVPLVLNPHGLEEFDAGGVGLKRLAYRPLQWSVRATARAADRVVATDGSLVAAVQDRLGLPASRIALIPNAIDLERIDGLTDSSAGAACRRRLGLALEDPLFLSVGRLEANKGFDLMIAALAELSRAENSAARAGLGSRWRWVLAGDGPLRSSLARAVRAEGLEARVLFTGALPDEALHAWYEAATVFVHPTRYEGSSLVTLEAMAHRRPVIAARVGGLPDKVRPGVNGWLVPPNRADALAAAVVEALHAGPRLREMGEAGRAIVAREFAWSAVIDRWLDLYREVLTRRNQ